VARRDRLIAAFVPTAVLTTIITAIITAIIPAVITAIIPAIIRSTGVVPTTTAVIPTLLLDTTGDLGSTVLSLPLVVDHLVLYLIALAQHVALVEPGDVAEDIVATLAGADEAESTVVPTARNALLPLDGGAAAGVLGAGAGAPGGEAG
jgi:hypothetical protein